MDEEERAHASDDGCVSQGVFVGEFLPAEFGTDARFPSEARRNVVVAY